MWAHQDAAPDRVARRQGLGLSQAFTLVPGSQERASPAGHPSCRVVGQWSWRAAPGFGVHPLPEARLPLTPDNAPGASGPLATHLAGRGSAGVLSTAGPSPLSICSQMPDILATQPRGSSHSAEVLSTPGAQGSPGPKAWRASGGPGSPGRDGRAACWSSASDLGTGAPGLGSVQLAGPPCLRVPLGPGGL